MHTGRVELTSFLPENTQAAIIQPIGNDGILIAASNTQRGFTRLDQVPVSPMPFTASIPVLHYHWGPTVHVLQLHAEHDRIIPHKLTADESHTPAAGRSAC